MKGLMMARVFGSVKGPDLLSRLTNSIQTKMLQDEDLKAIRSVTKTISLKNMMSSEEQLSIVHRDAYRS